MPQFSPQSVGILAQLLDRGWRHSDLDNLILRYQLTDAPKRGGQVPNKKVRATTALSDALNRGQYDTIKRIIEEYIEDRSTDVEEPLMKSFITELRGDGWSLDVVEYQPTNRSPWDTKVYTRYELNVLGGGVAPLIDDTTALGRLLVRNSLNTAAGHYNQAVDANALGKWASANGQLRSALESVLVAISDKLTGTPAASGGGAINALDRAGHFDKGARNYIEGLWTLTHSNGSHPGLSDEEESTNRIQAVTAAIAYLLRRFM
ncbi:MAG TPA: hypothetical protein VL294_03210 [Pseudolysinimonas sp.]|jgi:hypothetical protein|nr:hypothetical protein [Pseudolysinimonas sp.]